MDRALECKLLTSGGSKRKQNSSTAAHLLSRPCCSRPSCSFSAQKTKPRTNFTQKTHPACETIKFLLAASNLGVERVEVEKGRRKGEGQKEKWCEFDFVKKKKKLLLFLSSLSREKTRFAHLSSLSPSPRFSLVSLLAFFAQSKAKKQRGAEEREQEEFFLSGSSEEENCSSFSSSTLSLARSPPLLARARSRRRVQFPSLTRSTSLLA